MTQFEFVLPFNQEDLLTAQDINQYVVEDVCRIRDIPEKLHECQQAYTSEGGRMILSKFDVFYSVLRNFSKLDVDVREEAWYIIYNATCKLSEELATQLEDSSEYFEERADYLNSLKMSVYIFCQLTEAFEIEATKPATDAVLSTKKSKKKSTKKKSDGGCDSSRFTKLVQCLQNLCQMPLKKLWTPPVIEEDFLSLVSNLCFRLLENPNNARNKALKTALLNFLGIVLKNYTSTLGFSLKIIQMVQQSEHLTSTLSEAVDIFANTYGAKNIVCEILREISQLDIRDLGRDTSGTKYLSQFIVDLAEKVPLLVLNSVSLLLPFLDEENYTLRICVLSVLGMIVEKILSSDDLSDKEKEHRDQILDKLQEHIHDVNAFVRSRTLQTWCNLFTERAVPISKHYPLLQLVSGRLLDKSSIVRKHAIQFVTVFLQCNPYAAKLSIEELSAKHKEEKAKLDEMMPEEKQDEHEIKWQTIEPLLAAAFNEEDDNVENYAWNEDTVLNQVFCDIHSSLLEGSYRKAVTILKCAMKECPDFELFKQDTEEDSEDPMVVDCEEEKDNNSFLVQISKAIFFGTYHIELSQDNEERNSSQEILEKSVIDIQEQEKIDKENTNKEPDELAKQLTLVKYLEDTMKFAEQIQRTLPVVCQLLYSKTVSDVQEAIDFFVTAFEFGVHNSIMGIRLMISLVWSKESSVKQAVVNAYRKLYLTSSDGSGRAKTVQIVKNLSSLFHNATVGELASIEEMIKQFVQMGEINEQMIHVLWERFSMKLPDTTPEDSRYALLLLGMAAGKEPDIVKKNLDVLCSVGLGATHNFRLVRDTCSAFLKLVTKKPSIEDKEPPFRLPQSHTIFEKLTEQIVGGITYLDDHYWVPMAEQAVNTIYGLAEFPDTICGNIIKQLISTIHKEPTASASGDASSEHKATCNANVLARFLCFLGHVALCQLFHLEISIFTELKRRQFMQEHKKQSKGRKSLSRLSRSVAASKNKDTCEANDDDLGVVGAVADDAEAEYIRKICENDIVCGDNLLALIAPLIVTISSNPVKYGDPKLASSAALALAKFMMVSSEFCDTHMQLLVTIMEKTTEPLIRANTIIALADLSVCFPNLIEPWTPHIYGRLQDSDPVVRKSTLTVLTHLILHDMIKVKGQISDVALRIVDSEKEISGMAKFLFHELAKKGNAIYNILPDIISRLSDPEHRTDAENFKVISKFLFQFIEKERQVESLVEKLCHRFQAARDEQQWRDLAHCLSLLTYSDRCILKLQENIACYADKLRVDAVYESFTSIMTATKKSSNLKEETKVLLEELEVQLEEFRKQNTSEEELIQKAQNAVNKAKSKSTSHTPGKEKPNAASARKSRRKKNSNELSSAPRSSRLRNKANSLEEIEDNAFKTPIPRRTGRELRSGKKKAVQFDFSSDESD